MNIDFERVLFYAVIVTGAVSLLDLIFFTKKRKQTQKKMPFIVDYARSFFPVLMVVFFLRSFLYEPFRIPSGSLLPTLLVGDFILVNKYDYGIRLPVMHKKIIETDAPQRGDIIIFRWPPNPSVQFIKRVIGLPGDRVSYLNKELYVNGQKIPQTSAQITMAPDENSGEWRALEKQEDLFGVKHGIYLDPNQTTEDYRNVIVPPGMYFVMGDNRDKSADSRYWGFVPEENIIGKAVLIWASWDGANKRFRFDRMGEVIH